MLRIICWVPWLVAGAVGALFLHYSIAVGVVTYWEWWCSLSLPAFLLIGCFTGLFSVLTHIRQLGFRLRLEELLLTRLTARELVQGLGFPPLAAQMSGWLVGAVTQMILLGVYLHHRWSGGFTVPLMATLMLLGHLMLAMQVPKLMGISMLRAALYLDSPSKAVLFALRDSFLSKAGFGLCAVFFISFVLYFIMPQAGLLLLAFGITRDAEIYEFTRDAIVEAGNHPRFWAFAGARQQPTEFPATLTYTEYFLSAHDKIAP